MIYGHKIRVGDHKRIKLVVIFLGSMKNINNNGWPYMDIGDRLKSIKLFCTYFYFYFYLYFQPFSANNKQVVGDRLWKSCRILKVFIILKHFQELLDPEFQRYGSIWKPSEHTLVTWKGGHEEVSLHAIHRAVPHFCSYQDQLSIQHIQVFSWALDALIISLHNVLF